MFGFSNRATEEKPVPEIATSAAVVEHHKPHRCKGKKKKQLQIPAKKDTKIARRNSKHKLMTLDLSDMAYDSN